MIPSIGRNVHYTSHGSPVLPDGTQKYKPLTRAAIITDVPTDASVLVVGLCILNPTGMFFDEAVPYSETPQPGHWSWPPRV